MEVVGVEVFGVVEVVVGVVEVGVGVVVIVVAANTCRLCIFINTVPLSCWAVYVE